MYTFIHQTNTSATHHLYVITISNVRAFALTVRYALRSMRAAMLCDVPPIIYDAQSNN